MSGAGSGGTADGRAADNMRQTTASTDQLLFTDRIFNLGRAASGHAALTLHDLRRLCATQPDIESAIREVAAAPDQAALDAPAPWGGRAAWRQKAIDGHPGKRSVALIVHSAPCPHAPAWAVGVSHSARPGTAIPAARGPPTTWWYRCVCSLWSATPVSIAIPMKSA